MGKDSKARQQPGKLLPFAPTGEYYFSKGIKAYHRRDLNKAKKYMHRAMQLEPGEPMIVCQLAVICAELGDYQYSNSLLHMILEELDEEMAECHYFLANNYAHLGFFKDAYHHANLYLDLDQDGEFTEDTEDLLDLLTLEAEELEEELYDQDDLMIRQEHARELLEAGHFPKAVAILNGVIKEYPEYWSAYNNLALAYFYLGETEKASGILDEVLKLNPGNLHAICNRLVFSYYENKTEEVNELKEVLRKIKPISVEHQYKLGATFALIGEYEHAYVWLRKLQRQGYEGDGGFYYWLAYAAYFTEREQAAKMIWKKVLELNPEKEGLEPWNEDRDPANGFEDHIPSIMKKLASNYPEERLFALFLTAHSNKKNDILASGQMIANQRFTAIEKQYVVLLNQKAAGLEAHLAKMAHDTAEWLYRFHRPIGTKEAGLYLMWFSVFVEAVKAGQDLKNTKAWAAAIEYVWHKLRNEKVPQHTIAKQYGLSGSTLQKYVKMVNICLQ
ncbi:tetratricopeptide repeat protein [Bacillus sp. V3-13]|uniref:tetratricopeptide repeat protein n=1 Tax=Bacillus sp. V3-13 TaxID=2053728 RepID=UPI000C785ABA|nr:tetratricopeptide repeat protein [Bacillus sp. V3-13]PLR78145.1 tetratricopeptide repeat protein [Bacillus sp. V3-13]